MSQGEIDQEPLKTKQTSSLEASTITRMAPQHHHETHACMFTVNPGVPCWQLHMMHAHRCTQHVCMSGGTYVQACLGSDSAAASTGTYQAVHLMPRGRATAPHNSATSGSRPVLHGPPCHSCHSSMCVSVAEYDSPAP